MNDSYVECLVPQKTKSSTNLLKIGCIVLAVVFLMLMLMTGMVVALVPAIAFGALGYVMTMSASIEYEYLYVEKEITIDKVINKSRRKNVGSFEIERLEILAPVKSYHLDDYKNRSFSVKDYSIGYEQQPDLRYALIYDGKEKLILSPSPEFVTAIKNVAPRKVFTD